MISFSPLKLGWSLPPSRARIAHSEVVSTAPAFSSCLNANFLKTKLRICITATPCPYPECTGDIGPSGEPRDISRKQGAIFDRSVCFASFVELATAPRAQWTLIFDGSSTGGRIFPVQKTKLDTPLRLDTGTRARAESFLKVHSQVVYGQTVFASHITTYFLSAPHFEQSLVEEGLATRV